MDSNHKITYPHFYFNQVLRSSTLNSYFAFMDRQTRLSRVHLLGCGIVDGLTFSMDGDALVLSKGVAVNKDGWLIKIPEEIRYRFAADVDFSEEDFLSDDLEVLMSLGGSRIKKICFQAEDDVRQFQNRIPEPLSSLNPNDYVVALAYGIRNEYNSRCSQDSCDLNTTDKVLEAWPVLIEAGNVEALFKKLEPMEFAVSPRKEPCIECGHGTVESFNGQVLASARLWKAEITEVLNKVASHIEGISKEAWDRLFPYESVMQGMDDALKRVEGLLDSGNVQDYYVSFFGDLGMALNEFIEEYNAFARQYEVLPCRDVADNLIYLGRFDDETRDGIDGYRSLFRKALDGELLKDGAKLGRMLRRIGTLVHSFIGDKSEQSLANVAFGLMKVRPTGRLSSRPIPFYYDRSKEGFYEIWNADGLSSAGKAGQSFMDGYLTGSVSMNEEGWSYYPTAYQGKDLSVVRGDLESLDKDLRLSLNIVEAGLNNRVILTKKEAELLGKAFASFSGSKREAFVKKVKSECAGDAFKLAEIMSECYDARLLDALQAGRPLAGEESAAFRKISSLAQIGENGISELALAFQKANGGSTAQNTMKELNSAFSHFVQAWKGSFISTGDTGLLEEIGRSVSLAPVRRGCRVFLFTKQGKTDSVVVSYGVVYRMQADAVNAPDRVKPAFRILSNEQVTGEYASVIPDLVRPFDESGIWKRTNDEISFIPYVLDGTTLKMFEATRDNVDFQVADETILQDGRVDILEKKYPCVVLKMVGNNGRTLVTLKIKDGSNWYSQNFYVEVENPVWVKRPVTSLTINPSSYQQAVGQTFMVVYKMVPEKPTNGNLLWAPGDDTIVSVKKGMVTCLKEGLTTVTVTSESNPEKKAIATVTVFSYRFRMKLAEKKNGDLYRDLPETVAPYGDGGIWEVSDEQVFIIAPFMYLGSEYKEHVTGKDNLICTVGDESILQPSVELSSKSSMPYVALKMLEKNGSTTVNIKLLKSKNSVLLSKDITVVVSNSKWGKTQVKTVAVMPQKVPMYVNQVKTLTAIPTPADASASFTWHSSDPSIASVDGSKGEVTAIKTGNVQITATANPGGKHDSATVTVSKISFKLKTTKQNDNTEFGFTDDFGDTVRPYGDNGKWSTKENRMLLYLFKTSDEAKLGSNLGFADELVVPEISNSSVLSATHTTGGLYLNMLQNGTSSVTIKIKDPEDKGKILLTRAFKVEVDNPELSRFNKISLQILQEASTLSGATSISLTLEYTSYEVDASGKKTGKIAKGVWSEEWAKKTTKTANIPLGDNWYFNNKVQIVLMARTSKTSNWTIQKKGDVLVSDGKLKFKIIGSYNKSIDLGGSSSDGFAQII